MKPPDFHPEFNFVYLTHWMEIWLKYYEAEESSFDLTKEMCDDLFKEHQSAEHYFRKYFEASDEHGLEACKICSYLIMFATPAQMDNEDFAYAVLTHFMDTPNKMVGPLFFGQHPFSTRISRNIYELSVSQALLQLGNDLEIAIEKHRLESITSKPRFTFDFEKKPAIVEEAPKPKMRMKI